MTINSTTRKAGPFIGNGSAASFPFTFKVFQASDLDVVKLNTSTSVEQTLVLTADYTVTLNQDQDSNPGGTVTLTAGALPTGFTLTLTSDVANLQPTDLTNQGGFYPEVINDSLDRATIQIQQLQEQVDRSLKLPLSSTASADLPAPEASKFLGWNSNASAITNYSPADFITIVGQQNSYADLFTGDGVTTNFTLTRNPGSVFNIDVSIQGVSQAPNVDYILNGTILSFTTAPPAVNSRVLARYSEVFALNSADASNVRYVPAGSGAVTTNVQAKLRETVSVKDFGAVGDGVADDTAAIQAAINSFNTSGGAIYFPPGNYKITAALTSPQAWYEENETLLFGAGGATIITSTHDGPVINFAGSTTKIQDMVFVGPGTSNLNSTAYFGTLSKGTLINCNISNFHIGVNIDNTIGGVIDRCYIHHCYHGIHAVTTPLGVFINILEISNTWLDTNTIGLSATKVLVSQFNNLTLNNNTLAGANLDEVYNVTFNGLWCEQPATDLVVCTNCVPTFISSRVFVSYNYNNIESLGLAKTKVEIANGILKNTQVQFDSWNPDDLEYKISTFAKPFPEFPAAGEWLPAIQWVHPDYPNNLIKFRMNPTDGTSYLTTPVNTGTNGLLSLTTTSASDIIGLELFNNTYPNSGKPTIAFTNWSGGGLYSPRLKASGNAIYFSGLVGGGTTTGGEFSALSDAGPTLGSASHRWNTVYAATGTINTSDAKQKQQTTSLTEAEKSVAKAIKKLIKTFKYNSAVAEKGENARIHVGVVAQEVEAVFIAQGLDPTHYGLFCVDVDENGVEHFGVRYDELLAFVIAAI